MTKNLSWRELKALFELYTEGSTTAKIQNHPYIVFLKEDKKILDNKLGNKKILIKTDGYDDYYRHNHWNDFKHYNEFLATRNILNHSSRYAEDDIQVLILVAQNRDEILTSLTTQRTFSSIFFKNKDSKHLEKHPGLEKAILSILGIPHFPDKDPQNNQFRYVVDCKNRKNIVLCENLSFLKIPWKAREHFVELWYVGGNNVEKLNHIDLTEITCPIYYSCDWDYDGLKIYQRIKEYIPNLNLLKPINPMFKSTRTDNHKSYWKKNMPFSSLDSSKYDPESLSLIKELIDNDTWIEEESNDLYRMLDNAS